MDPGCKERAERRESCRVPSQLMGARIGRVKSAQSQLCGRGGVAGFSWEVQAGGRRKD